MFVVVLTGPVDHVRACLAHALRQCCDLLTGDIVDGEVYNIASWQAEVDNGAAVEGVGVVLHEDEGLGHWSCPCLYNGGRGLVESDPLIFIGESRSHSLLTIFWKSAGTFLDLRIIG